MTEGIAAMAGAHGAGNKTERNIVVEGPGRVAVRDEPRAPVPPSAFRVTTVFSGISAGTELSYVKGTNPFLSERWDPGLGLFVPGEPDAGYPVTRLGYMEVGTVTESRTPAIPVGGTVAMAYGHRTGYTGDPAADRVVLLPEDLDPLLGIYVAHMGPICANGLLHAAADLYGPDVRSLGDGVRGRRVVVVGAGVVALFTALLARRHGAASVVVLDPAPRRRAVAEALGLESLDPEGPNDPAASLKTRWRHAPGDRGADVVFQCRGQPAALHLALRTARPQATVIDLAFYQAGAAELRLGAEFHHNGLAVRCAQIGRVPRGLAHTWDRERLSSETIDLLHADGTAIREHLITAVVPFEDAPELFTDLAARRRHELQAVLAFDSSMTQPRPAAGQANQASHHVSGPCAADGARLPEVSGAGPGSATAGPGEGGPAVAQKETDAADVTLDLLAIQSHALEAIRDYSRYLRNAENAGLPEVAYFVHLLMEEDSARVTHCQGLLRKLGSTGGGSNSAVAGNGIP